MYRLVSAVNINIDNFQNKRIWGVPASKARPGMFAAHMSQVQFTVNLCPIGRASEV